MQFNILDFLYIYMYIEINKKILLFEIHNSEKKKLKTESH